MEFNAAERAALDEMYWRERANGEADRRARRGLVNRMNLPVG